MAKRIKISEIIINGEMEIYEQPVIFKNSRSQQLFDVSQLPIKKNKPPIVKMAHGFTDDKTGDNRLFVKFVRKAGIAVLRFDFAGSTGSEGLLTKLGFRL